MSNRYGPRMTNGGHPKPKPQPSGTQADKPTTTPKPSR